MYELTLHCQVKSHFQQGDSSFWNFILTKFLAMFLYFFKGTVKQSKSFLSIAFWSELTDYRVCIDMHWHAKIFSHPTTLLSYSMQKMINVFILQSKVLLPPICMHRFQQAVSVPLCTCNLFMPTVRSFNSMLSMMQKINFPILQFDFCSYLKILCIPSRALTAFSFLEQRKEVCFSFSAFTTITH